MTLSDVQDAPPDVVRLMRNLIDPTDGASHADGERALMDRARQLGGILGSLFYRFDDDFRPFCGFVYNIADPEIVMPLRNITSTPEISYRESYHDVAAIQFSSDMELLAPRDKWDKAVNSIDEKITTYLEDAFTRKRGIRNHKFKIIIFDDLDDLNTQLEELSKKELVNPIEELVSTRARFKSDKTQNNPPSCSLRSLSLQIHDTEIAVENPIQGSYFFNLISSKSADFSPYDSISKIQCCIPILSEPNTIVGNFINLVISFLIAINLNEGETQNFGRATRHRIVKKNLDKVAQGYERRAFFCEQTIESEEELANVTPPASSIVSFDTKYHVSNQENPSEFYRWLHEYNFRVFNKPMLPNIPAAMLDWEPRDFFYPVYDRCISFFYDLEEYSDTWKSHKDKNIHFFHNQQGQIKPKGHHSLKMYQDIIKEVKENEDFDKVKKEILESSSSLTIQFLFYSEIISLVLKIHNNLIAPSGHLEKDDEYSFFFKAGGARVSLRDLMYLSMYNDLVTLGDKITRFEKEMKDSGTPYANAWRGFSSYWRLERRSTT